MYILVYIVSGWLGYLSIQLYISLASVLYTYMYMYMYNVHVHKYNVCISMYTMYNCVHVRS